MRRWQRATCWAAAGAVLGTLFYCDQPLFTLLNCPKPVSAFWAPLLDAVRVMGRWPGVALAALLLGRGCRQGLRWAVLTVVAVGLAALAGELTWRAVGRVRPCSTEPPGRTVLHGPLIGFNNSRTAPSFPATEAVAAAALAVVLARAEPRLKWVWYSAAFAAAWLRVRAGAHFPSDAWAGLMLGVAVSGACLNVARRSGAIILPSPAENPAGEFEAAPPPVPTGRR